MTLDEGPQPDPGPNGYIRIGDNLVPGWTLSLLAITLLIAPLLTAGDTWLRERRNDWRTRRTIVWAAERALLPLAALLLAYLLGLVGLIPDPAFPYDPGLYPPGSSGPIAFAALAAAVALAALLVRPMRTPLDVEPQTLAAAAGLLTGLAIFGIWLLNPYLALLLAPAAHVWLPAARASGPPRASALAIVALLSLIPALVAFATVAGQLDLGAGAPWQFLLLIEDGQVSLLTSLLWCALLGGLISCVAAAGAGSARVAAARADRQHPRSRQPRRARRARGHPAGEPPPRLIRRSPRHGSRRGSGHGSGRLAGRSSEAAKAVPAGVDGGGEGHQDRKCESTPSEVQCVPTMNNSRSFKTRSLAASTRSTPSASQSRSWNGSACCRVPTSEAAKVVVSCYRN